MRDTTEQSRGRTERRRVEVYSAPACDHDWPSLRSVVQVTRSGLRDGEFYERTGLYVTRRRDDAAALGDVVRQHWHVENRLHRCKDVQMTEDTGGVRSTVGASLLSLLRGVALSVLRHHGEWSPTEARSRFANRPGAMLRMLST